MRNVTRTLYGIGIQTAREMGVDYDQLPNSTLNEAVRKINGYQLSKEPTATRTQGAGFNPALDTQEMRTQYLAIGRGALTQKTITGANATIDIPVPHATTDSGFYSIMPFAMFDTTSGTPDFASSTERAKYRLRRFVEVNGTLYVAYYLYKLDYSAVSIAHQYYKIVNGVKTAPVNYQPTDVQLTPNRPNMPDGGVMPSDGTFYAASGAVNIVFDQAMIQNITNAMEILVGYPEAAKISEYGFVTGVDTEFQDYASLTYTDVVGAMVSSFLVADDSLVGQTSVTKSVNLGNAEPTYGVSNIGP